MPLGNRLQKKWQNFTFHTENSVNGLWKNERNNIIPFENPCLDKKDRLLGKEILTKKNKKIKEFCFVGGLNNNKGVNVIKF